MTNSPMTAPRRESVSCGPVGCGSLIVIRQQQPLAPSRRYDKTSFNPTETSMTTLWQKLHLPTLIATAALAAAAGSASATDVKVKLIGTEETPPVTTSATGTGTITIAADKSVSGSLKTTGIDGTVAHIHVGAPGASRPPII